MACHFKSVEGRSTRIRVCTGPQIALTLPYLTEVQVFRNKVGRILGVFTLIALSFSNYSFGERSRDRLRKGDRVITFVEITGEFPEYIPRTEVGTVTSSNGDETYTVEWEVKARLSGKKTKVKEIFKRNELERVVGSLRHVRKHDTVFATSPPRQRMGRAENQMEPRLKVKYVGENGTIIGKPIGNWTRKKTMALMVDDYETEKTRASIARRRGCEPKFLAAASY